MALHGVGLVADVEGHHHLLAGALRMVAHHRHHGRHALGQRRMQRIGRDLVVLDEVHARGAQPRHQLGGLRGREADVGLDDGAHQRARFHAGGATGAGHAVARPLELRAVGRGQLQRFEPQPRDLAEVVEIARDRGRQRRQVGADVGDGKGDVDQRAPPRPAPALALEQRIGQAGCRGRLEFGDGLDGGARPCAQVVGLALDAREGAARLLARHHLGHRGRLERRLDAVARADALFCLRHRQSFDRSGKGRTGSLPSQPSEAARIRSNILPFGPATSDSSITVPGWYSVSK